MTTVHMCALLIQIRSYVPPNTALKDLADLVAHPDLRDQGLTHGQLFHEWGLLTISVDKEFNLDHVPAYAMDVIRWHVRHASAEHLQRNRLSVKNALRTIKEIYSVQSDGSYALTNRMPPKLFQLIRETCRSIRVRPAFSTDAILSEIIALLVRLKIRHDCEQLTARAAQFQLHLLLMLHEVRFKLHGDFFGKTWIDVDTSEDGTERLVIFVSAQVPTAHLPQDATVAFGLVSTPLDPRIVCEPTLLREREDGRLGLRGTKLGYEVNPQSRLDFARR